MIVNENPVQLTVPLLTSRIKDAAHTDTLLKKGEVLLPEVIAKGMQVKTGDTVVLVANNKDGSVNGMTYKVAGVVESLMGPGGRDGYLHIADAKDLLRMPQMEVSEVVVRVENFDALPTIAQAVSDTLTPMKNKKGKPMFEVHTWDELSPFYNVVRMIDLMTLGIKAILIAVVLISILNVMMMSVYERIREVGTLAAMGTPPRRIMGLFVAEGFLLGLASALAGAVIGLGILWVLNITGIEVAFGRSGRLFQLAPSVALMEVVSVCLVVLAISILASLQPAAKAARLDPVESLRHV